MKKAPIWFLIAMGNNLKRPPIRFLIVSPGIFQYGAYIVYIYGFLFLCQENFNRAPPSFIIAMGEYFQEGVFVVLNLGAKNFERTSPRFFKMGEKN